MTKIRVDLDEYKALLKARDENRSEESRTEVLLGKVIDALGLRESYPNETTEHLLPRDRFEIMNGMPQRKATITISGASRFKADVLKAADAARGEEALTRLRTALKEATS